MAYKITAKVYQTTPPAFFNIREKTTLVGDNWSKVGGTHVLDMISSGTSGTLRFVSDTGEMFLVALGVHNYKRWCDIVVNLTDKDSGTIINPQYYSGDRAPAREAQRASYGVTNLQGRKIDVVFTVADGTDLHANIIIG